MKLRYLQIFFSGTWIQDSNHQWDPGFLELYSGSKAQYSGFHKQKFPRFRNQDSLTCGENQPYQLQTMSTTEKYGLSLIISPVKIVQQQHDQCGIGVKYAISRQQVRIPEERTLVLCCTFFFFLVFLFCFVLVCFFNISLRLVSLILTGDRLQLQEVFLVTYWHNLLFDRKTSMPQKTTTAVPGDNRKDVQRSQTNLLKQ